jgi:hypothetical protein
MLKRERLMGYLFSSMSYVPLSSTFAALLVPLDHWQKVGSLGQGRNSGDNEGTLQTRVVPPRSNALDARVSHSTTT